MRREFLLVTAVLGVWMTATSSGCGGKVFVDVPGAGGAGGTGAGGDNKAAGVSSSFASSSVASTSVSSTSVTVGSSVGSTSTSSTAVSSSSSSSGAGGSPPTHVRCTNGEQCNDGDVCCFNPNGP